MAFSTYGVDDVPDLVSANSVLGGKIDGAVSDGAVSIFPNDWDSASFDPRIDFGISDPTGGANVTKRRLINVATPTADSDVATKGYVDGVVNPLTFHIKHNIKSAVNGGKITPGQSLLVSFSIEATIPDGVTRDNSIVFITGVTFIEKEIMDRLIVARSYMSVISGSTPSIDANLVLYNPTDETFTRTRMNIFYDLLWFT